MKLIIKRSFDLIFACLGVLILTPFFLLISLLILIDSGYPIFFTQTRVGKHGKDFTILKFRTMFVDSEKLGSLTLGNSDKRVTKIGGFLRKYKLDELPQLFNVINGSMSFVGPRPELRNYVELFKTEYQDILKVKPGITDYASIKYYNESELLKDTINPEEIYTENILPDKIKLCKKYVKEHNLVIDIKILFNTILLYFKI